MHKANFRQHSCDIEGPLALCLCHGQLQRLELIDETSTEHASPFDYLILSDEPFRPTTSTKCAGSKPLDFKLPTNNGPLHQYKGQSPFPRPPPRRHRNNIPLLHWHTSIDRARDRLQQDAYPSCDGGNRHAERGCDYGKVGERDAEVRHLCLREWDEILEGEVLIERYRAELGRAAWKVLHTTMARFPDKPTQDEQTALFSYVHLFARLYPWYVVLFTQAQFLFVSKIAD